MARSIISTPLLLVLWAVLSSKALAELAYDGFITEVVSSTKAISGTFFPNPRNNNKPMMVLNAKKGQVNVLENPDESPDSLKILDLSDGEKLCTNGERGLHTVIPSPNFVENRHLFAFFTKYREDCLEDPEDGPHNVVMRFTMDPETLMLDYDEGKLIFRGPPMDERLHNGGAMAFGNDGKLYITMGDAGVRDNAVTLDDVHGTIIRLNEDGTVPDDNPYTQASGYKNSYRCADTEGRVPKNAPENSYCGEIWANGLRNPFRLDMDHSVKDKVKFSFGVVGAQHIEAIYYGGTDYKGTNYGWPKYEGVCRPAHIDECEPNTDPSITMPFHWYEHISFNDGGCVGGQAHVPEGIWPPEFKYLFIDFILLKIYNLELNRPDLACEECSPPLPPTRNETFYTSIQNEGENINRARMVDMWFGPYKDTQALYVTRFGNHDTVLRIRYTGVVNKPPKPDFQYDFEGDLAVRFDASLTTDPEGDKLKYKWDFGDESESDKTIVSHQYSQPGEYRVTLRVTDSKKQEQQITDTVKVGSPPKVTIISPAANANFSVGEILRLNGEAVDSMGNPIPEERLSWEVRQHHADHFHPFLDPTTNMNDFDLYPAPDPEDYMAATNSFLKVLLTAKDEYGLSETVSVDVMPEIVMVNVTTQPAGLEVVVDGFGIEAPKIITSWKDFLLPVTVADQPPYIFKEWSDGRTARTREVAIFTEVNGELPQVQALFCTALSTYCENHDECCSGYCSAGMNGVCEVMPTATTSPTRAPFAWVPDPDPLDFEIDVVSPSFYGERPLDLLYQKGSDDNVSHEETSSSENDSASASFSKNDSASETTGAQKILLEYVPYAAIALSLCVVVCFLARCKRCKKVKKYSDQTQGANDDSGSDIEHGNDDDYYYDGNIKATETSSTEESEENFSPPAPDDNVCNNSDISLSFLVPESMSSEPGDLVDVENQLDGASDSSDAAIVTDTYLMPPLAPSPSIAHPEERAFDDSQDEPEVIGILQYVFDATSSFLSGGSEQVSFGDTSANQSVSLSIFSDEESNHIQANSGTKTLPDANAVLKSDDSSVERDLGETSKAIDSLALSYLKEKSESEVKDEKSSSTQLPLLDNNGSSFEESIDEYERALDMILSLSFESSKNLVINEDLTKASEETSLLNQLCVSSPEKAPKYPVSESQNKNTPGIKLSPMTALESGKGSSASETVQFMSPQPNHFQKLTEETPETVLFDADESSVESNESDGDQISKFIDMNLQSTFATSVDGSMIADIFEDDALFLC